MKTIDQKSDRYAWGVIILLLALSLIIEGTTAQMEIARHGLTKAGGVKVQWLYQITSHAAMLISCLTIPLWLKRFPLSLTNLKRRLPVYLLGFLVFTISHILLMVNFRHLAWGVVSTGQYGFGLWSFEPWAYEVRKDLFSYLLILSTFLTSRHIGVLHEDLAAARQDAKRTGRISLKSGGRTLSLPASEIIHAKSSGNYVELHTSSAKHFIRITLAELEELLREADADPIRLHRSHLIARHYLRGFDASSATLSTGTTVPVGRKYRTRLEA